MSGATVVGTDLRELGQTGLSVTAVCVGGAPLGSVPDTFGYDVPADRGVATAARVLSGPLNFLDTAAGYSDGESERRIGVAIAAVGGVPNGFVVATKVDRDSVTGDFSGAQVRRSADASRRRLGLDHLPLLYLHDPEVMGFDDAVAADGPVRELIRLREEGVCDHIGVAGGPVALMSRFLQLGEFEVLITHNRWTLVDRSAGDLIEEAVTAGVGVVNGAPFGGGILAKGSRTRSTYAYTAAPEGVLQRVRAIEEVCREADVPLAAAALQFSLRDPRITSTIVGVSRPERIEETLALAAHPVPDAAWAELIGLAAPPDLWQW